MPSVQQKSEIGSLEAKVQHCGPIYGLAFGFYCEMSPAVSKLFDDLAEERKGRMASFLSCGIDHAKAVVKRRIMRRVGLRLAFGWSEYKIQVYVRGVCQGMLTGGSSERFDQEVVSLQNELAVDENQYLNWRPSDLGGPLSLAG